MGLHVVQHRHGKAAGSLQALLHGLAGPTGHDLVRERDAARRGIDATGSAHADAGNRNASRGGNFQKLRRHVASALQHRFPTTSGLGGNFALKRHARLLASRIEGHQRTGNLRAADVNGTNQKRVIHAPAFPRNEQCHHGSASKAPAATARQLIRRK